MSDIEAGALVAEARRRAGISQQLLAERIGVKQPLIAAYERGKRQPTVPTLRRLVEATGARLNLSLDAAPVADSSVQRWHPMTLDRLAGYLVGAGDPERLQLIAEFLTEYTFDDRSTRSRLLTRRPRPTGSRHWDALLGALAEHLALHDDATIPQWVDEPDRFLDTFWFPMNAPFARTHAFVHAPASFRRRGVFFPREGLIRA